MVISWNQCLSYFPETPSKVISQFLWYNNNIKIEDAVLYFQKSSNKNINFLSQLFENSRMKSRVILKHEYKLTNSRFWSEWIRKHTCKSLHIIFLTDVK